MPLADIDLDKTSEPEVVRAVIDEMKTFGDDTKKNHDELRKNHEELKKLVDEGSGDPLAVEKLGKLTSDIVTRQEGLDDSVAKQNAENQKRMDSIEVALNRSPRGNAGSEGSDIEKEAKAFAINSLAVKRDSDVSVSAEEIENLEVNVKEYEDYKNAFNSWVRKYGGTRDRLMPADQVKALQVGIDTDGGMTVPVSMSSRIIKRIFESDPIRQLAASESITTGALKWMVDIDEAGYAWEGEITGETTITGETSIPGWREKKIVVHTIAARPRATQTLLEDSGINIEAWLAEKVAAKFLRGEAAAFVNGDGIGKPRGFLTHTAGTSWGQVEQANMGAAANLTGDGFVNVKYALKEFFLERGVWLMNRTTVQAAMKIKTGQGEYVWKPSMLANDPSSAILNLPVRMSTTMPAVAADALSVVIADWAEAYMIVDRLGISVQRDPFTVKPFIEFFSRKRVGGDVTNYDAIKIGKIAA